MPKGPDGKWSTFTPAEATATETGEPVKGFPIKFEWHAGPWKDVFDAQIDLIKNDVKRARVEDRLIVYLSCPISARGGGYSGTNVDIAKFTERALLQRWGTGFWVLNPAQYQLESKAGVGLLEQHAKDLGLDLHALTSAAPPSGGDYMRMWTRVILENDVALGFETVSAKMKNTAQHFDAFYFLGPRDVQAFFMIDGQSLTTGIESYFSCRESTDADFRDTFAVDGITWGSKPPAGSPGGMAREIWTRKRSEFFRYYGLRASGNFSLGSHDEWNIFCRINALRRKRSAGPGRLDGDASVQLGGFFDGGQLDPASTETEVSRGYEV